MKSRTQQALALIAAGMLPAHAAREVGLHHATVYNALRRARRPVCPTCGRPLK